MAAQESELVEAAAEGIEQGAGHLVTTISDTWGYQLTAIEGQTITVGSVVIALALLVMGYLVSRLLSRALGRALVSRIKLESGPATAVETLSFYLMFVAFAVTSLRIVSFPLTAFTIAGGALAIGVGFGSQNVMNNFISGLILMLERPIRVGDLIRIDPTYGIVEQIGARSTRVRASDNTHVIVPNSFFLESNVVNFTLSDDVIRSHIVVGVIYGSPTREVERLIRRALEEHGSVLRDPECRILFADFGDNSLVFDVYFWQRARSILERRTIESDVRFRIDDLFREAGIVIAFPQRDVHLDSARPLEVRLVDGDAHRAQER